MKTAIDAISGSVVDDARIAWERSQRTSVDVLRDMGAEVVRLAGAMDGSAESMQALGQATSEYRSAVGATLLAIRQLGAEMTAMFSTTRDALETYGLSPEALYDRYRQDADAAMAMLASATDPESVRTLAERINADINAAFSALGDDGKSQQKDPLLEYLNGVDAFVQSKLATISASVSSSTADPFAAVNAALSNAASLFQKQADGMQGAVDKMDQVVDKMDRVVTNLGQTPLQAYVVTNEVG
jgi:flagellin-like hook-associated protein FlgL